MSLQSSTVAPSVCPLGFANAYVEDGFCADLLPINVGQPRGVRSVGTTDFLYVDRSSSSVVYVFDSDGDGIVDSSSIAGSASGLNHGIALHGGYVYASSATEVYRWPHDDSFNFGVVETVVNGISEGGQGGAPGGHTTRTLEFSSDGTLYISVGSLGNVDSDSSRSRIRRFPEFQDPTFSEFPIVFNDGEVFADGLRNEVGLAFDRHNVLWGVENGADNLYREDLGGDINNDNPAEELNRFPEELAGQHWGYPYCWSEYILPDGVGMGPKTQWVWPSFLQTYTDEYCRTETVQSELALQAHSAPLGIVFYHFPETLPDSCVGTFPKRMDGYAFIAYHGSWNRDIPTGYKVVYVPMDDQGRVPQGEGPHDLLRNQGSDARWPTGFRPVDVDFDDCGRLLLTSDGSRSGGGAALVRISYATPPFTEAQSTVGPTVTPTGDPTTNDSSTSSKRISIYACPVQCILLVSTFGALRMSHFLL